jgi:hypothetical protein
VEPYIPTEFLNTESRSLYFVLVLHSPHSPLCFCCTFSFSRITNLYDLQNSSVPQITPTEFLINVMIILNFKEKISTVLHLEHNFVWC